ncbi:MAG: DNA repair protein RadA, partial [Gammaproteobacteria bacterium]|nr:DNA repair protein RadA [Gammaproteobacteria bacterium]
SEVDRTLGGGFVPGSVTILAGDPGVGKSTLMLQLLAHLSKEYVCCYLSGEESLPQIKMRGDRLGLQHSRFFLGAQTELEQILDALAHKKPQFVVIDSIQTIFSSSIDGVAGSVTQVRHCAQLLTRYAKQNNVALLLIGHVNKEGNIAGPKVFEHLVDTVLYLESDDQGKYRLLRTFKNRFGAVGELGILCMMPDGLKPVLHPSAIFTNWQAKSVSGTTLTALWEGSRALLVEMQSLVVDSPGFQGKRVVVGFDLARLNLLLAILSRFYDWPGSRYDVFLNIVGGLKVQEPAADCAVLVAVYSSLKNWIIPKEWLIFGELGLGGELRPVQYAQERIAAALKHGYKKVLIPAGNAAGLKEYIAQGHVVLLSDLKELLSFVAEHAILT